MRDSVRQAFGAFTRRFEGHLLWLYLDVKGLVTIGDGDLVDPMPLAEGLPFVHRDGTPATVDEVRAAWLKVKAATAMARLGGGAFAQLTTLRLTEEGVDQLVQGRLALNERILQQSFDGFEAWCADAQLGTLSMAWAMGGGFASKFPIFTEAANEGDWDRCAGLPGDAGQEPIKRGEAWMEDNHLPGPNPANPGLHARNLANRVLFQNAAEVAIDPDRDPATLYYPTVL